MLSFPIRLMSSADGGVRLCFPDVPEAVVERATEDEAVEAAGEALEAALRKRLQDGRGIPAPSDICGAPTVSTTRFVFEPAEEDRVAPLSGGRF